MEADYPAAHSMDSQWFAVDRAGHVGFFRTGENGAMPENVMDGNAAEDVEEQLRRIVPAGDSIFVRNGRHPPGRCLRWEHAVLGPREWVADILLFLDTLDPLREEVDAGRAAVSPSTYGVAIVLRGIPMEVYQRLHATNLCRGCFREYDIIPQIMQRTLSRHGLFRYEAFDWSGLAYPYGLLERPTRPLHFDSLPPTLRQQLGRLQLNVLFPETVHLQPVEHVPCWTSGPNAWLDATGTIIRPLPGSEESYAEEFAELCAAFPEVRVEPPRSA